MFFSIHLPFTTPHSPTLHRDPHITPTSCNSLCFPSLLTPLHTFCPLHFFRNRNEGIERRWKCRSAERGREEKKLRRSEKGRGKSQAVEHANDLNKYNIDSSWRILSFGINFWQPSPHSTLHSTLAPPNHFTLPPPHSTHPSTYFTPFLHLCPLYVERGKGKKLRRSGEARRKEFQEVGQTLAHAEKKGKAYTSHCMKDKLPWPTLCFAKAPPLLVRA